MTPSPILTEPVEACASFCNRDADETPARGLSGRQKSGLGLAPLACAWLLWAPAPTGVTGEMRAVAALTAVMALLWVCESIPLAATALLPLVALPIAGVAKPGEAAQSYAGDLIFLFIGGFILANGIERWGLHRRVAFWILAVAGNNKRCIVGSLMASTAFISLWISNTAAALLMMPVGLSLVSGAVDGEEEDGNFGAAMVLGIGVAATIGGMGTPIGSTPNLLFVNTVERLCGLDVGFGQWMLMGIPLVVLFTGFAWWMLAFQMFRPGSDVSVPGRSGTGGAGHDFPAPSSGEILVGLVFLLTVCGWIFRETRTLGPYTFGLTRLWPHVSDGTVAIAGALALFAVPISLRPVRFALDWERGGKIPWDIILLFGGGLSLADGIARSGLDVLLVSKLGGLQAAPGWLVLLIVCIACVALSEVASNTATAALLMPLVGSLAVALGKNPLFLMLPVALATSLGFMLPVATPPNALALATGKVTVWQMAVAGLLLNIAGLLLIVGACYLLGFPSFHVGTAVGLR